MDIHNKNITGVYIKYCLCQYLLTWRRYEFLRLCQTNLTQTNVHLITSSDDDDGDGDDDDDDGDDKNCGDGNNNNIYSSYSSNNDK
jgi:hypothetical protein